MGGGKGWWCLEVMTLEICTVASESGGEAQRGRHLAGEQFRGASVREETGPVEKLLGTPRNPH